MRKLLIVIEQTAHRPSTTPLIKHIGLLGLLTLTMVGAFAQSAKPLQRVRPKWKLGDEKTVQTESASKIYIKDSLLNNTTTKIIYHIKVVDTVSNYTLQYYKDANTTEIESKSANQRMDSAVNMFVGIMKQLENESNQFKYELVVDKKTGQALRVKNADGYMEAMLQSAARMIDDISKKKEKTPGQADSMKQKLADYFKRSKPKAIETIINQFNYIMQAYALTFPLNASVSQKALVHDVNALSDFGNVEIPAVITVRSKKNNQTLTVLTDTDYDKEALLVQIKKKYGDKDHITAADIFLSEKVETIFTTSSSWLVSHKSNIVFKMREVKVLSETNISFE